MITGRDLKLYRESIGLKQQFVAASSGINIKKLSRIETERQNLTVADLEAVCVNGFGIRVTDLYEWIEQVKRGTA